MDDRPPPPITVSIPGRGAAPAELLAVGEPSEREGPPRRPPATRSVLRLLAAVVVGAGALVTYDRVSAPDPPVPPVVPVSIRGVSAGVSIPGASLVDRPLRVRLDLALTLAAGEAEAVRLLDIVGKGFQIRLPRGTFPRTLGPPPPGGRTYNLQLNVVVSDCATGFLEPRRLDVQVQRPGQEAASLPAEVSPDAVRALDRLVGTTCRRPRG